MRWVECNLSVEVSELGKRNSQLMQAAISRQDDYIVRHNRKQAQRWGDHVERNLVFTGLWQPATQAMPNWCRFSVLLTGSDGSKWRNTLFRAM